MRDDHERGLAERERADRTQRPSRSRVPRRRGTSRPAARPSTQLRKHDGKDGEQSEPAAIVDAERPRRDHAAEDQQRLTPDPVATEPIVAACRRPRRRRRASTRRDHPGVTHGTRDAARPTSRAHRESTTTRSRARCGASRSALDGLRVAVVRTGIAIGAVGRRRRQHRPQHRTACEAQHAAQLVQLSAPRESEIRHEHEGIEVPGERERVTDAENRRRVHQHEVVGTAKRARWSRDVGWTRTRPGSAPSVRPAGRRARGACH